MFSFFKNEKKQSDSPLRQTEHYLKELEYQILEFFITNAKLNKWEEEKEELAKFREKILHYFHMKKQTEDYKENDSVDYIEISKKMRILLDEIRKEAPIFLEKFKKMS